MEFLNHFGTYICLTDFKAYSYVGIYYDQILVSLCEAETRLTQQEINSVPHHIPKFFMPALIKDMADGVLVLQQGHSCNRVSCMFTRREIVVRRES